MLSGAWLMVPIIFAGLTYGVNLHFVTTILPSHLGLDGIYKNLNYGKIGATMGGLLSGLWVSQIAVNDRYIEFGFYILAIGSAFLVLLPLCARAIFARYEQSQ